MLENLELLLRSTLKCSIDDPEDVFDNAQVLEKELNGVDWVNSVPSLHRDLFGYVIGYLSVNHVPPTDKYLLTTINNPDHIKYIGEISKKRPLSTVEFGLLLTKVSDEFSKKSLKEKAQKALDSGSAEDMATELVRISLTHKVKSKTESFFMDQDTDGASEAYREEEKKPPVGIMTGVSSTLDLVTNGLQLGELTFWAGFVGEMKSTTMMNISHNAAEYGHNVFYASFEMMPKQCRNVLHTIHGYKLAAKLQRESFTYDSLRKRMLTPEEREFYFDYVLSDIKNNRELGKIWVERPNKVVSVEDMRRTMMEIEKKTGIEFDLAVFDYVKLMKPSRNIPSKEDPINECIREMKMLAMTYQGRGLSAVSGFAINRKGKSEAVLADGRYTLAALQAHNAAEQSGDIIVANYLDDKLRALGEMKLTILKNRDGEIPRESLLTLKADLPYRYVADLQEADSSVRVEDFQV